MSTSSPALRAKRCKRGDALSHHCWMFFVTDIFSCPSTTRSDPNRGKVYSATPRWRKSSASSTLSERVILRKTTMNLNNLLRTKGIDPQEVLVFRHRPFETEL